MSPGPTAGQSDDLSQITPGQDVSPRAKSPEIRPPRVEPTGRLTGSVPNPVARVTAEAIGEDLESAPEAAVDLKPESAAQPSGTAGEEHPARRSRHSARHSESRSRRTGRRRTTNRSGWNEIGVDGLPIRRTERSPATELAGETEPTSPRDVIRLLAAFGVSLVLAQLSVWWLVGIDPLGLAPPLSPWLPLIVPEGLV